MIAMEKYMKSYLLFVLLFLSTAVGAQKSYIVTGYVTDEARQPIVGVTVAEKGKNTGEVDYESPDYIVINYGVNDYRFDADIFTENYLELLKVIRKRCPSSKIFILPCFRGDHFEVLRNFIDEYNKNFDDNLYFIDSTDWVPKEPLHPLRTGHKIIAEKLTSALAKLL